MKPILAILLILATTPIGAASEGECDARGNVSLGVVEFFTPAAVFYIDDRNFVFGNGVWIYQETNGVYAGPLGGGGPTNPHADLQRGGSSDFSTESEICVDDPELVPDQLIF